MVGSCRRWTEGVDISWIEWLKDVDELLAHHALSDFGVFGYIPIILSRELGFRLAKILARHVECLFRHVGEF